MKRISMILAVVLFLVTGLETSAQAQEAEASASSIEWNKTTFDFGKVPQGKPVTTEFEFTNSSMVPLIINSVQSSCGCTVPSYPKEPILPGKTGKIVVTFNAATTGPFSKSILVNTNATEGYASLVIKGEVESL